MNTSMMSLDDFSALEDLYAYPKMPTDDLPPSKRMSIGYLFELTSSLSRYHQLFYALHEIGIPTLTTTISTACVCFRADNSINFRFNPNFMDMLTDYEVKFVFCHEALHVVYQHGLRGNDLPYQNLVGIAMDICVNESLIFHFSFERDRLPHLGGRGMSPYDGQWLDGVFTPEEIAEHDIRRGQTMEYYYDLLVRLKPEMKGEDGFDIHGPLMETSTEANNAALIEAIEGKMDNPRSIRELIEKHCGKGGASGWTFVPRRGIRRSESWERIILQWAKMKIKHWYKDKFILPGRRHADLLRSAPNMVLPSPHEYKKKIPRKSKVIGFLDCSGSCTDLAPTFFRALESIPKEHFEVVPFAFDTAVTPVDMKTRMIPSGGGTSFCILEEAVQMYMKENNEPYPEGIFVLTDGYGDQIHPQIGSRWHWFLTRSHSKECVPKDSHIHKLADYYKEDTAHE